MTSVLEIVRRAFRQLRAPERRSSGTQAMSWADFRRALGGTPSLTGRLVTETSAMSYSAVFAAVRILAESIGCLPLMVYERVDRGKRRAPEHPVYSLLHDAPNADMTAATFKETLQAHLALWGNGYARIIFGGDGRPVELSPRMPNVTTPMRIRGGDRRYRTYDADGVPEMLYRAEILHVPGIGFDGLQGVSVIHYAREAVGLGLAAEEFGARFFGNGANSGGVYEHPNSLSDNALKHLRESITEKNVGLSNAHSPMILEEGMKFNKIGIPPDDAQFLETRKFQVTEIARIYRIPPHMLADLDRATFSNIEQMSLEFLKYTLLPWLVKWEQELNRKLFLPEERRRFFVEFLVDDFLRGDVAARTASYHAAVQDGWLSRNEVREMENRNPIEGGDVYLVPTNLQPSTELDKAGAGTKDYGTKPDEPPPTKKRDEALATSLLAEERGRIMRRFSDRLARAQKKFSAGGDREEWVKDYFAEERERSLEALTLRARLSGLSETEAPARALSWLDEWQAEALTGEGK